MSFRAPFRKPALSPSQPPPVAAAPAKCYPMKKVESLWAIIHKDAGFLVRDAQGRPEVFETRQDARARLDNMGILCQQVYKITQFKKP